MTPSASGGKLLLSPFPNLAVQNFFLKKANRSNQKKNWWTNRNKNITRKKIRKRKRRENKQTNKQFPLAVERFLGESVYIYHLSGNHLGRATSPRIPPPEEERKKKKKGKCVKNLLKNCPRLFTATVPFWVAETTRPESTINAGCDGILPCVSPRILDRESARILS